MDFSTILSPVPPQAKFQSAEYYTWGGSMVSDSEGRCHLYYSRWPHSTGFQAWVSHSEIAHAVSDEPTGPYQHVDVALPVRGAGYWDGLCTHNPTIHMFGGKYYLYYMGNTGDGRISKGLNMSHRNNQRIGVAVANDPNGPWTRLEQPLIDVGESEASQDALMTSNPSLCQRPDGTYLMVYKCVGKKQSLPFGGPVVHMVATSASPAGPFTKHPEPVFTSEGDSFPAEDPYIWTQDGKFWAIVKDMNGAFTGTKNSLALFESDNGFRWAPCRAPLITTPQIDWQETGPEKIERLERPQLWFENGIPAVLFCAAKDGNRTFNVHIPLARCNRKKGPPHNSMQARPDSTPD